MPICFPPTSAVLMQTQTLFGPLIDKLGFQFASDDDPDTTELRSLAICYSMRARDPKYCVLFIVPSTTDHLRYQGHRHTPGDVRSLHCQRRRFRDSPRAGVGNARIGTDPSSLLDSANAPTGRPLRWSRWISRHQGAIREGGTRQLEELMRVRAPGLTGRRIGLTAPQYRDDVCARRSRNPGRLRLHQGQDQASRLP